MTTIRIALAGIGKIAREQHIPSLEASTEFELAGAVTRHEAPRGIPAFCSVDELVEARPEVTALSICTPPRGRLQLIRAAFERGLDVMIEKPPAATLTEAQCAVDLAAASGRVLFVTWHSRAAAAVEPTRRWLESRRIQRVDVTWKEDVRVWHPGQSWIWEPGIGVFDPGINALSVITRILPEPLVLEDATLRFPQNKAAPIAASLKLAGPHGLPVYVELDFDQRGTQTWTVDVQTDAGPLSLSHGGSRLTVDGQTVTTSGDGEYPALYRRFAALLADRRSDTDLTPLTLVADSFLLGRRIPAPAFKDF